MSIRLNEPLPIQKVGPGHYRVVGSAFFFVRVHSQLWVLRREGQEEPVALGRQREWMSLRDGVAALARASAVARQALRASKGVG